MGVFRNSMMIKDGLYPEKNLKPLQQWQHQTLHPQAQGLAQASLARAAEKTFVQKTGAVHPLS